ncbi:class I SAM-dependent methyltransferase [Mycolicibacterium sp. 050158]|uniref:class I SAM-dependent methyltransferase n=1 Tax=Mycolicibacterium sp. 050158 TaxID=3090602 RepID=UPI00299E2F19|nr:methyltransferase domain-containing protein [Mycolicibacterium sp. 050158]MDX1888199.1 methyltransferase domain-containing protein [Mycolicibacterium sp. 050158]
MPSRKPIERYHDLVREDVFPVLPDQVGRLLDFGGGVGATGAALKRLRRASYVAIADQVAGAYDEIDRVFCGDLEDPGFISEVLADTGPFDTILALDVLEHLRDPWGAIEQLRTGLAPQGVIVASIPNVNYYGLVLPLVFRGRFTLTDSGILDRTHIRWFARHGAIELMSAPGLEVEVVSWNIPGRRAALANKLTLGLFRRFFVLQYLIRSRRIP